MSHSCCLGPVAPAHASFVPRVGVHRSRADLNSARALCHGGSAGQAGLQRVDTVLTEALSVVIRWLHVVAGIAWIGSSFYFIHLDLSLKPNNSLPAGVRGEAWQVHG